MDKKLPSEQPKVCFEQLKTSYNNILNIALQIAELIDKQDVDQVNEILKQKRDLIKNVNRIKSKVEASESQKNAIRAIIEKIKQVEDSNIIKMQNLKSNVMNEIAINVKSSKLVSAYKIKKETKPRLLDVKE